jgi:2-keto-4-pentenoate hydratase/2-oxohepta-3-ene-1,7-dioic acid hydratase in catechol pathway
LKLLTFIENGQQKLAVKTEQGIVPVSKALETIPEQTDRAVPRTMQDVIDGGEAAVLILRAYVDKVISSIEGSGSDLLLDEAALTLGPCVTRPNNIICVGLNYRKHALETHLAIPEHPVLFTKCSNTLSGHGADVLLPTAVTSKVDYEAELAIVIGKTAKYVAEEDALSHVLGYCIANDLSARDLQLRTSQWLTGKSLDGFCPIGPYLVTAEEVGDPNCLQIRLTVNGEQRQSSNTADMIFRCSEIVSYISRHMTLVPGDIILTGTPEGVMMGYPEEKQVYLKNGDVVTIEIEKLGRLTNRMVAEQ